ncbi:MAG: TonB-dependent receptor, partial [Myxococcota bacterium]
MRVSLPLVLGMSWLLMPATLRADDAGESADVIDISDLNLDDLLSIPIVQGASLRSQSIVDAPVSVSFLSSEDIATLLPFKTTDLFRAVPGMFVGYTTANFAEVGARGIQLSNNNRVVSFLDGVQNQDPEVGVGRYAFSPLSPYDLHSVEVVRGSGSTFFGANAASAVVLLESRRSTNSQGLHAHFSEGLHYVPTRANESPSDPILRNGGNGYLGYGWMNEDRTFGVYGAGGFNAAPEWEEIEPTRVRHGRVQYGARLNVDWLPDSSTDLQLGLHHTFAEFDTATSSGNPAQAFAIRENRLNLRGRRSLSDELTVSVRASVRGERSSTDGILVDDLAVAVGDNESFMWNGALQLDWNGFDERNFFTAVVESRAVRVIEVAGAEQRQRFHSLVLQDELQLLDDRSLVLLAGARFASITARDIADENDTVDYRFISPRGGLLYRLSPTASLRFVGSVSYRTPNFVEVFTPFELDAFEEPVPPVAFSVTNLQLRPEQFTVFELGYR